MILPGLKTTCRRRALSRSGLLIMCLFPCKVLEEARTGPSIMTDKKLVVQLTAWHRLSVCLLTRMTTALAWHRNLKGWEETGGDRRRGLDSHYKQRLVTPVAVKSEGSWGVFWVGGRKKNLTFPKILKNGKAIKRRIDMQGIILWNSSNKVTCIQWRTVTVIHSYNLI